MTISPYDLVILGSGSTAFAAALQGAQMGARVLMVEQSRLGGTCVNWGCVPSKTLIAKAEAYFEARRTEPYGLNLSAAPPDYQRLMQAKRYVVEQLRGEHYQQVLNDNENIDVLRGHGRFLSRRELQVGADTLISERFLIACGGVPRILRIPGLSEIDYLTSYSAMHLQRFPASILIIGGGVIALEMGQMFRRFGTEVTILERGERILKEFDPRLTTVLADVMRQEGINLVVNAETQEVAQTGVTCSLRALVGGEEQLFSAERIMLAVGTAPATTGIGLEEAGVAVDEAGFIITDPQMRTSAAGIWAAGDCTGPPLIAPAGEREGEVAVISMLDPQAAGRIDHSHTPMAVFVDPQLAMIGSFTAQCAERPAVETFFDLRQVAKAHILGDRRGGIVLRADRDSGRLLGVQMLAPNAAEIIHEGVLAVRFGLTAADLAETLHVYPTIAEGLQLAAREHVRRHGTGKNPS
jgi:mercuric reductase